MSPAAIIFDYDGVISDSEVASNECFARVLSAAGMPTSLDDMYDLYIGRNWPDTLVAMTARWGDLVPHDIRDRIIADYLATTTSPLPPVEGFLDFIEIVAHLPVAVASSNASDHIRHGLRALGVAERFGDHVYSGSEHVTRGKPFPDLYLHAADALGFAPAQILVVEDSPIGARAALASGARVFGLAAGSHHRPAFTEALRAEGVERVFDSYAEIAAHLELAPLLRREAPCSSQNLPRTVMP